METRWLVKLCNIDIGRTLIAKKKFLGQFLAVGWTDGVVRLMGLENNKTAHHINVCEGQQAKIGCIGWAVNTLGTSESRRRFKATSDRLLKKAEGNDKESLVDLPRELTFLDIETSLPKLSPLPTATAGNG